MRMTPTIMTRPRRRLMTRIRLNLLRMNRPTHRSRPRTTVPTIMPPMTTTLRLKPDTLTRTPMPLMMIMVPITVTRLRPKPSTTSLSLTLTKRRTTT